jgi:hypothetical protein
MMTRSPASWQLVVGSLAVAWLGGCSLLPSRSPLLQTATVRSTIERATAVPLDNVSPVVAATGSSSLRATMSGSSFDGTIVALVFWNTDTSGAPLGNARRGSTSVQTTRLPGGMIALRRLNVLVFYQRDASGPDLAVRLRSALAYASAG